MDRIEDYSIAINDFHQARNQAQLREIIARFKGKPISLLSFDEIRHKLRASGSIERGLLDIPIKSIVGSLGRYDDFTRDFLPRKDSIKDRWARVRVAFTGMLGVPPIDVYKIGDVYFVKDGNHRVSVAKQIGALSIQAYVTEIQSRVPLEPNISPDELIIKEEYLTFLELTRLDINRPDCDLSITVPGQYNLLMEHISVHQYYLGLEKGKEIEFEYAATHWYDNYYLPIVQKILELGILRRFPGRTEADLYIFVAEHRSDLENKLGWRVETDTAIQAYIEKIRKGNIGEVVHFFEALLISLTGGKLISGPPTGNWRQTISSLKREDRIFQEILVPIDGKDSGWKALQQSFVVSKKEISVILGLHVITNDREFTENSMNRIKDEFYQQCNYENVHAQLAFPKGNITDTICERSRYADLVIINTSFPPGPNILNRLENDLHELIQRCPRPILLTTGTISPLEKPLLAYDGSPKSTEALYISAYLSKRWHLPLYVISVKENRYQASTCLREAKIYLESQNIRANYFNLSGETANVILQTADENHCDFLIMGGYGYSPFLEILRGSVVDQILRNRSIPVLICR